MQARVSEKRRVSETSGVLATSEVWGLTIDTLAIPSAWLSAVSRESARRRSIPGLTISRSTTMSMSCFLFLSRTISSARSIGVPSMTTRTKPSFLNWTSSFRYSPLRPRTIGERRVMRVPSGIAIIWSTIWETVWEVISLPQL